MIKVGKNLTVDFSGIAKEGMVRERTELLIFGEVTAASEVLLERCKGRRC